MLGNLIAKYASVLEGQEKPDAPGNEDQQETAQPAGHISKKQTAQKHIRQKQNRFCRIRSIHFFSQYVYKTLEQNLKTEEYGSKKPDSI